MLLIRALSTVPLRHFRACLIAGFERRNTSPTREPAGSATAGDAGMAP